MPSRPFLVASFPRLASLAGGYTRMTPGSSTDTVLEHALDDGVSTDVQSLGLLQGWRRPDEADFVARLRHGGAYVDVVRRMPAGCLVRYAHRVPSDPGSAAALLRDVGDSLEPVWMHVEAGLHSIRGACHDGRHADAVARRLRVAWAGRGVACDVDVRHVATGDHRAWVDLPASLREASGLIRPYGRVALA